MFNSLKSVIDIGSYSTKIIEYKVSKKNLTIVNAYQVEGINSEELASNITNAIKAKQGVIMLPSDSVLLKDVSKKDLKSKIKELSKDGYNSDYTELGGEVFLFNYVEKELLESVVDPLSKNRLTIKAVDTNSSAMFYLSTIYNSFETKILLDIGHLSSRVLIVHKGEVVKYCKLSIGIYQIVQNIKESIGTSYSKAMEIVLRLGLNKDRLPVNANDVLKDINLTSLEYGSAVHDQMEFLLERIADSLRVDEPLKAKESKLILLGGGSLISGVENVISESLGIKVEAFSIVSSIQKNTNITNDTDKKLNSVYASAIGLAIREVYDEKN